MEYEYISKVMREGKGRGHLENGIDKREEKESEFFSTKDTEATLCESAAMFIKNGGQLSGCTQQAFHYFLFLVPTRVDK